jgi:hypothetical protein
MVAFNVGATYAVARFSAVAIAQGAGARALVPAVQSVAMVIGPLVGAAAIAQGVFGGLGIVAALALLGGVGALFADGRNPNPNPLKAIAPAAQLRNDFVGNQNGP